MPKRLFLIGTVFILFIFTSIFGAYLTDVPQTIIQPNGEIVRCFASGDEFYNWLHDANGYTIIQDPNTGYYVYAEKSNGALVPSKYIVGIVDPANVGLVRFLKITSEEYRQRMASYVGRYTSDMEPSYAPQTGTINNIAIFIRFSDENEFTEPISTYDDMFNSSTYNYNSMYNYFREVSYYQLTINSTFYPTPSTTVVSYQDTYPRSYYQVYDPITNPNGYSGDVEERDREHTLLKNAVDAVSYQIPTSLNVDGDNDGYVDNVCFIIYGSPEGWAELLWPHKWSLYSQTAYINGKQVWTYNFQLQTSVDVGVLCHEMFHSLGAPDLYHYSHDGLSPVGPWDLMEWDRDPPQHMGAYMKYRYGGWITSIPEITTPGTYSLNPLTSSTNNCFKIASPNTADEYFIVEYRYKTGSIFENSLPGSGLLVYRINTNRDGMGNASGPPDEVYIYRPDGTINNNGDIYNAHFRSDVGRTEINDNTNPSSFLSDGSPGGLVLSNIGSAGNNISFLFNTSPLAQDSLALVDLYNSTNGDNWTRNDNWLTGPVSTWYGITVSDGRVTSVDLNDNLLSGTIPSDLGNLSNLQYLVLNNNQLSSSIPPELGSLWNLATLSLYRNQLSGSIPSEFSNLSNLQLLDLENNRLSGSIPSELGNLPNLQYLSLGHNQLSGSIPPELGNLSNLQALSLGDNQLNGFIPSELGNLSNLQGLYLYTNQLSGSIPFELGNISNLQGLNLSFNQLSGSIPPELGNLSSLQYLYLYANQLSGSVPSELVNLWNLKYFWLQNNQFMDMPDLSSINSLDYLRIENNKFTFEDIEPNVGVATTFIYSPQDSVGTERDTTVSLGSSLTLTISVGGWHNQYQWKKDDVIIPGATDNVYTIASVALSDSGTYTCKITNTVATQLTLYSRPINVTIIPTGEQVVATVGCGDFGEATQIIVPIDIDMSGVNPPNEKLGSYTATLDWDPMLLAYVSYAGGTTPGWSSPTVNEANVSTGHLGFANANASGSVGTVNIINITFDVVGSVGQSGIIDLEFSAMTSATTFFNLMPILTIQDCDYMITPAGILGDVNDDTFVNSTDALIVLSCDVGINVSQFCPMNCGDTNNDGLVNSTDALIILSYDVGISVPFPVGQPGCPKNVTPCPGCNP